MTALVLLPLAFDVSFPVAMAMLLAVAAAFGAAGAALLPRRPEAGTLLAATGTVVALLTAAWSSADREASLLVLSLTAVLVGALSVVRALPAAPAGIAVAVAGGLGTAALAAGGAAQELATDQVGGLLLLAVAGLLAVAALPVVGPARRLGAHSLL